MTKDTIVFGGLAGMAGNILKNAITWFFYFSGLIKYTYIHFCAGVVVSPVIHVKDPLSLVIGFLIDYTIAAVFGVAICMTIRKTGIQHWFIKGLGFGMVVFLICYGILRPTFSLRFESTPFVVLLYIIPSLVYGVVTCWFLKKYGVFKESGE